MKSFAILSIALAAFASASDILPPSGINYEGTDFMLQDIEGPKPAWMSWDNNSTDSPVVYRNLPNSEYTEWLQLQFSNNYTFGGHIYATNDDAVDQNNPLIMYLKPTDSKPEYAVRVGRWADVYTAGLAASGTYKWGNWTVLSPPDTSYGENWDVVFGGVEGEWSSCSSDGQGELFFGNVPEEGEESVCSSSMAGYRMGLFYKGNRW